jgi:predicted Abi (CAAX) family protease
MNPTLLQRNQVSLTVESLEDRQMMSATPMAWAAPTPAAAPMNRVANLTNSTMKVETNISAATDAFSISARGVCATPLLSAQAKEDRMEIAKGRKTLAELQGLAQHTPNQDVLERLKAAFEQMRRENKPALQANDIKYMMNCTGNRDMLEILEAQKAAQRRLRETSVGPSPIKFDFNSIFQAKQPPANNAVPAVFYGQPPSWAK